MCDITPSLPISLIICASFWAQWFLWQHRYPQSREKGSRSLSWFRWGVAIVTGDASEQQSSTYSNCDRLARIRQLIRGKCRSLHRWITMNSLFIFLQCICIRNSHLIKKDVQLSLQTISIFLFFLIARNVCLNSPDQGHCNNKQIIR